MSNITRGQEDLGYIKPFIPFHIALLNCSIEMVLRDTLWSLSNICDMSDEATLFLVKEDTKNSVICKALSILAGENKKEITVPALRLLGNMVSNKDDSVTCHIIDLGLLNDIKKFL